MKVLRTTFLLLLLQLGFFAYSQQVGVGQWRDDLPYSECISIADAGSRIYCATPYAVFFYDREDNTLQRITKINGLSDIGISTISYNKEYGTLVIAYTNANIDLFRNNTITNISDIKRASILGNKTINDIYFDGKYAYLACGFGIVLLDIDKNEIRDTYYIGQSGSQVNVLSLTKNQHDTLFAATEAGIYLASSQNPNLANYASWTRDLRINPTVPYSAIEFFNNEVIVSKPMTTGTTDSLYRFHNGVWSHWPQETTGKINSIRASADLLLVAFTYNVVYFNQDFSYNNTLFSYFPGNPFPLDMICDNNHVIWVADNYSGMMSYEISTAITKSYNLNGPNTAGVFSMKTMGNKLYIVPGGRDNSYVPIYKNAEVYAFDSDFWTNIFSWNNSLLNGVNDFVVVAPDPSDPNHFFAGSWGRGLLEFSNNQAVARYTEGNSSLRHHSSSTDTSDVRVGGCAFDANGDLWVVNSHNNQCLSKKSGNQWTGYNISINNESDLGQLLIDSYGQKWIVMRYTNTNPYSLLVVPENPGTGTAKKLNSALGNGAIPGTTVYAIAEDHDGQIWIGTEKGIAVFYSPENVFTGQAFDAQQILVQQGLYTQYLMENELVTAIAVDGANNKWIGTDRGGLYQVSSDGTKQLQHFTTDNSPLFSNRITAIAINPVTGEVFIGTDKGVISYKGTATEGGETNDNVYAYPNPVKQDYTGLIAIKGLVSSAQVRIADVSGNLVYSTRAEGGQAIWDGKDFNGQRAKTGVYFVYANNDEGKAKVVTKILIIN